MTRPIRRRPLALALVSLTAAAALAGQTQTPQRPPVFRAGAVLVTVDTYPQRDGRIVEGLTAADFEVLEDGKPQAIEGAEFVRIEPGLSESERRDPNDSREMWELAADPHNRVFVVFLDAPHVTIDGSHTIRRPLVDTLNRIIAPNDLFGVTTHHIPARLLTLGRRLQTVEEQLTRYWPWGERNRITRDPSDPTEDYLWGCFAATPEGKSWTVEEDGVRRPLHEVLIDRRREDKVLTSLEDLVAYLALRREARTVLLVITDGWLLYTPDPQLASQARVLQSGPPMVGVAPGGRLAIPTQLDERRDPAACNNELMRLANLDNERRHRDLIRQANQANVSFYPVRPSGLAVFDTPISEVLVPARPDVNVVARDLNRVRGRVDGLKTLAHNTDGIAIVSTNDLAAGMRRIVDDVSAYYLLTYYSTNLRHDGRYRRIEVKVKRPEISIRARRGYMAPTDEPRGERPPGPAAPTVPPGADAALGVLARLRTSAEAFVHGVAIGGDVVVAVEIATGQLAGGLWNNGADVRVVLTTAAGASAGEGQGRIEPATRSALVRVSLAPGAAGPWRVAATIGTAPDRLEERGEIRPSEGRLIGDALVFRGTPAASSPLRAAADFQFRRTERVHLEWAVARPLDRREARLLSRNGQPLPVPVTVSERDANGRAELVADLVLSPLAAGDYVIELVVGAGAETERRWVGVRVVQ